MDNRNTHRYVARIIMDAQTPMFVGSGESSLLKDALVQKDFQGLPMIPGTALAGVLRHAFLDKFDKSKLNEYSEEDRNYYFNLIDLFGAQFRERPKNNKQEKDLFEVWYKTKYNTNKAPDGLGSRLKISSGCFLLPNYQVAEDITTEVEEDLRSRLDNLPIRKHVRINDKGVANKNGLFDNEIVHKGAKFIFEIELAGKTEDQSIWNQIIKEFKSPVFRIGQGTRRGYGRLKVEKIFTKIFNLETDFDEYLDYDPSFNSRLSFQEVSESLNEHGLTYHLSLKPDNFFIFSEGSGDDEVDNRPLVEEIIQYSQGKIIFTEQTVIPASSIKGSISHRVAFHYNRLQQNYADSISEPSEKYIGENNEAVTTLFGKKGNVGSIDKGKRGILVFDDLYYNDIDNSKIMNHVAIDRFTGGAIEGALFSEKVSYKKNENIEFNIYLTKSFNDKKIEESLEESLKDICKGLLPLGGMNTKGHGIFTGELRKNNELIYEYK